MLPTRLLMCAAISAALAWPTSAFGWTWPVQGPVLRPFLLGRRSVRGRPASRNRHRIALGGIGARACSRSRLLRRDRPRRRQDRLDPDRGRLLGHRPASRLRGGSAWRLDRGGRADRHGRPKRRGRVVGALRLSGRAAKRRAERVPGSAPFLAAARGCAELAACERGATGSCRFRGGPGGAWPSRRSARPRQTLRRPVSGVSSMRRRWTSPLLPRASLPTSQQPFMRPPCERPSAGPAAVAARRRRPIRSSARPRRRLVPGSTRLGRTSDKTRRGSGRARACKRRPSARFP